MAEWQVVDDAPPAAPDWSVVDSGQKESAWKVLKSAAGYAAKAALDISNPLVGGMVEAATPRPLDDGSVESGLHTAVKSAAHTALNVTNDLVNPVAGALDAYQSAKPYLNKYAPSINPVVNAPTVGVGGLVNMAQNAGQKPWRQNLADAAQGIRQGKTVGDYVTEAIPEPESPSVAKNLAINVGREAFGGITNLGIMSGAFEGAGKGWKLLSETADPLANVIADQPKTGKPFAAFNYNEPMTGQAYYRLFGDEGQILEATGGKHGWKTDLPQSTLDTLDIPVKGRTSRAVGMTPGVLDDAAKAATKQTGFADLDEPKAGDWKVLGDDQPTPPHQMSREDFLKEYDDIDRRTTLAEKDPAKVPLPEGLEPWSGQNPEDWSRKRGYSESEIKDFKRWLELNGDGKGFDYGADDPGDIYDQHLAHAKANPDIPMVADAPPTPPTPPPAGAEPPPAAPEPVPPLMSKADKIKRALVEPYQAIMNKAGAEIAPQFPEAGGNTTRSYQAASVMGGKTSGKIRQAMDAITQIADQHLQNKAEYDAASRVSFLNHMADLDAQGKTTGGWTGEKVAAELGNIQNKFGAETYGRMQTAAQEIAKTASDIKLGGFVNEGIITPERALDLKTRYPNYVPTQILDEESGMAARQPMALGKINLNMLKRKVGTERAVAEDGFNTIREGVAKGIAAAEKQHVVNSVLNEFGKVVGSEEKIPGSIMRKVNPDAIPAGYVETSVKTHDGKVWAVHKDIEDLLQGLHNEASDLVTKAMAQFNHVFREGATLYRAPFLATHAYRSFVNTLLTNRVAEGKGAMLPAMLRGLGSAVSDALGHPNELFQEFEKAGGGYGGLYTNVTSEASLPLKFQSTGRQIMTVGSSPFKLFGKMLRASDNIQRIGEFARMPGNMPMDLRANNARMVGIDFSKQGTKMKQIAKWIPFLNDKMQADWNAYQTLKVQPTVLAGKLAATTMLATMVGHQYNGMFPEDDMIDPQFRQHNYYAIVPDRAKSLAAGHLVAQTVLQNDVMVPLTVHVPKIGIDRYISNVLDAFMHYADQKGNGTRTAVPKLGLPGTPARSPVYPQIAKTYFDPGEQGRTLAGEVTPPLFKALIQQATNKNMWNGQPIVSERLQSVAPQHQFNTNTTNSARLLGQATGGSPVRIEQGARDLFPASGSVFEVGDLAMRGANKLGANIRPDLERRDKSALALSKDVQPFVSAPTGNYSVMGENSKDLEAQVKAPVSDARFMARQTYQRFLEEPTPENKANVSKYWSQISTDDQTRIKRQVDMLMAQKNTSPQNRAIQHGSKNIRSRIAAMVYEK